MNETFHTFWLPPLSSKKKKNRYSVQSRNVPFWMSNSHPQKINQILWSELLNREIVILPRPTNWIIVSASVTFSSRVYATRSGKHIRAQSLSCFPSSLPSDLLFHREFRSAQDSIYTLWKAHMRSSPSRSSFSNAAFKHLPAIWF